MSKWIQITLGKGSGQKFSNLDSAIPLDAFAKSRVLFGNINKFVNYFYQLNKKKLKEDNVVRVMKWFANISKQIKTIKFSIYEKV